MSLFPAYRPDDELQMKDVEEDNSMEACEAALERELLASDEEMTSPSLSAVATPPHARPTPVAAVEEWFVDRRMDRGNLRVSTLYYPGRPEYCARGRHAALGSEGGRRRARSPRRPRRYYETPAPPAPPSPHVVEARAREHRAALAAARDEEVALRYVVWSAAWLGADEALAAAREAVAACNTRRTREALAQARRRALPPTGVLGELRAELLTARGVHRAETWARLVEAAGAVSCVRLASAALDALAPAHYPRLLYACGASLRAGGLWERLVQLVELTAAMNFPPTETFPPPVDAEKVAALERDLADKEEKVCGSGLPLGTVWVRVERLRAAARWRAGAGGDADPQRRPAAGEVGGVLRAVPPRAALALLGALLRLARVPPLPSVGWVSRALPAEPESGEWLAALLYAARRLPASHPASPRGADPAALRAHLAALLDPPHYFSDSTGYLSWVNALWEACCGWAEGGERAALVAWRLRWLAMLAARAEEGEARRLRGEARAAVHRHAARDPHHHALLARLEALAEGAGRGARAALRACRAALHAPHPVALHAARVACELCPEPAARHALVAAVLRRALPPDENLTQPPTEADLAAAEAECERQCGELERAWEEERGEDAEEEGEEVLAAVCRALLPGAGEWGAARVALASPARRAALERAALSAPAPRGEEAQRYAEQQAVALTLAAAAEGRLTQAAAAFLPRFPESAVLALAASGAPAWAPPTAWPASHAASLARVACALVRGAPPDGVMRACARGESAGGAARWCAALCAAAGGARGADGVALAAVADLPHHKWVAVRAAAAAPHLASSLADALLERELRVHALFEELAPSPHF